MPIQELEMTSPYLQPFVALAMALPQLLESIEAELSNEKLEAGDVRHLCRRAESIRWLFSVEPNHLARRDASGAAGSAPAAAA
jgi:hypothetical protein